MVFPLGESREAFSVHLLIQWYPDLEEDVYREVRPDGCVGPVVGVEFKEVE
jgi:hypothetical protein